MCLKDVEVGVAVRGVPVTRAIVGIPLTQITFYDARFGSENIQPGHGLKGDGYNFLVEG